jgi:hypothetical protein
VVDGVVKDVVERVVVLLLRLDHSRPEALAEDVVLSAVPLVEGACVLAVEVAHAVGQVRELRLNEQVVVVAEQAAGVQPPAVGAPDALEDLKEDGAIPVVEKDRRVVVPLRSDVVVRARREVAEGTSHASTVTAAETAKGRVLRLGAGASRTRYVPGT